MTELQSRLSLVVRPPASAGLEQMLRSFLSGQQPTWPPPRQRPIRRDWNGVVCLSCGKSGHATRCPNLNESFPFMQPEWQAEKTRGVHYDPTPGVTRSTEGGKQRLIQGEGFASRVSDTVRPQDPGGRAMSIAAPRLMKTDDISDTAELFRWGGGAPVVPSRVSVVLVEETSAGDTGVFM